MREILEEIKVLQGKERGWVPNLRGASPIGRDEGILFVRGTDGRQRAASRGRR